MRKVFTKEWFAAAGIRAIKTFAQCALVMIPNAIMITQIDWKNVLGTAAAAAVLSLLTSMAGLPEVEDDGNTN